MTLREAASRIAALEDSQAQILERQALIAEELRLLRRGRGRADEESMVAFLELVRYAFGESPWTSGKVLAMALDQPMLRGAIVRVIGEHPTVQGLGRLLMSKLGTCGTFRLLCLRKHTEYGAQFRLTECVSASAENLLGCDKHDPVEEHTMTKDQEHILNELESFHLGKLDEIRVKRGVSTLDRPRQILIDGTISLKLDARERRLVVTWDE